MKRNVILFFLFLLTLLSSCASYADAPNPLATPHSSATLFSPFNATAQSAQVNAQNTIVSGQAIASNLNLTATAIGFQQLQNSIALTQAGYTQEIQVQRTLTAQSNTATAQSAMDATMAAQFTATSQAIASATAWPQTATPLAATEIAIIAEATDTERKLYWSRYISPFLLFFGAVVLVSIITAVIIIFRRLVPVWELRARTMISPDGETITYLPASEEIKALMPGRSFGSAMYSGKDETVISGIAPNLGLQDRVVARNQAIRLTASLPPGRTPQQVQRILAPPQDGDAAQSQDLPLIEVVDAEVVPVKNWVEEVSTKFLEEE